MRHDRLFKNLVKTFFAEFMQLFFPEKAAMLDLRRVRFLDKEVYTDVPRGEKRTLDIVAEVRTRTGRREIILIHVEVQKRLYADFDGRMFDYWVTLRQRYHRRVFPIALILSRTRVTIDRHPYVDEVLGEEVNEFQFWRIGLPRLPGARYVSLRNPLAPALAALMTPGTATRAEWKRECLRAVARTRLDRARQGLLVDCVETYLMLSPEEEVRFEKLMGRPENKEARAMRRSWSEQLLEQGEKLGEKRGVKLGEKRGVKLGEKRGVKLGEKRAKQEILLTQMRAKFGPLPTAMSKAVVEIHSMRRLEALLRRVLTAKTIMEMRISK